MEITITLQNIVDYVENGGNLNDMGYLLYTSIGPSAVFALAEKLNLPHHHCSGCEEDTPDDLDGDCLVCGLVREKTQ